MIKQEYNNQDNKYNCASDANLSCIPNENSAENITYKQFNTNITNLEQANYYLKQFNSGKDKNEGLNSLSQVLAVSNAETLKMISKAMKDNCFIPSLICLLNLDKNYQFSALQFIIILFKKNMSKEIDEIVSNKRIIKI